MSSESLVANRAPNTFLMESIQLVFIVHVMIFASDVAKGCLTNVTLIYRFGMGNCQMVAEDIRTSKCSAANVTLVGRHWTIWSSVSMQFEMFLEFQTLVESLTTYFTNGWHFTCNLARKMVRLFFILLFLAIKTKVQKFKKYVATQILREINFERSEFFQNPKCLDSLPVCFRMWSSKYSFLPKT